MMKENEILDKLMQSPRVKSLGLKRESVLDILDAHEDIIFTTLLDNGRIELGNGIVIEVVQLLDRVHVLRGISYKSSRKYKLKLTMDNTVYDKIEEYYDKLQEDIL